MGNMWILNKGDTSLTLSAGELFGFNLGSYVEIPTGMVSQKMSNYIIVIFLENRALFPR
jgi:hypothetical protein